MTDKPYTVALYMRMSKEDEGEEAAGSRKESSSITNQRMLLMEYLHTHPEFQGCRIIEKCDDGYSGKRLERPGWQELLQLACQGEIQCIIVKDFSRFGRDYIETGRCLEELFPFTGIRFIAVNDSYDSQKTGQEAAGMGIAFQNLINDFYSRDISQKLRSIRSTAAREGKFMSASAPYGYRKSPQDRHRLLIDEETAPVIQRIFRLRLEGLSTGRITQDLNAAGIPSPAQYALQKEQGRDWRRISKMSGWDPSKVTAVLKDERYTGSMVSLRRTLRGVCGSDTRLPQEAWVKVEHTHEAIVSRETFQRVQETFRGSRKKRHLKMDRTNVFICACCGRKLSDSRDRKKLICRFGAVNPQAACYQAAYPAKRIRAAVREALQWHLEQLLPEKSIQAAWQKKESAAEREATFLQKSLQALERKKICLYEQYREGILTKEEYISKRNALRAQTEELERKRQMIEEIRSRRKSIRGRKEQLTELMSLCCGTEDSEKKLVSLFVDQVRVYDETHIIVRWKFEEESPVFPEG